MDCVLAVLCHDFEESSGTVLVDAWALPDAYDASVWASDDSVPEEPKLSHGMMSAIGRGYTSGHLAGASGNNGTSPSEELYKGV